MIKNFPWRRKPWKVEWKNPWTKAPRVRWFESEAQAVAFEEAQRAIYEREKVLMTRARKRSRANAPAITIAELFREFLARPDIRESTRSSSGYHIKPILELFSARRAASLTLDDVRVFSEIQRGRNVGQSTINRRLSVLRAACNWAVSKGFLKESPIRNMKLPHAPSRRIEPPTIPEIDRLLKHAPEHIQRIILLGLYTGARPGPCELFRLRWDDILLDEGVIYMPCAYKSKTISARYVPIHEALLPKVREWRNQDGNTCSSVIHYRGKPVKRISETWRKLREKAGIARKIRPYDLRHAFATLSMAESGDIKSIAELMGHSTYTMLLSVYQHVSNALKIKAVNAIPAVASLKI